jgi:hypothetical protein
VHDHVRDGAFPRLEGDHRRTSTVHERTSHDAYRWFEAQSSDAAFQALWPDKWATMGMPTTPPKFAPVLNTPVAAMVSACAIRIVPAQ